MQSHWHTAQCAALRRKELETEAAQFRLASEGRKASRRVVRIYAPLMAYVGLRLITWGEHLQAQYSDSAAPAAPHSVIP